MKKIIMAMVVTSTFLIILVSIYKIEEAHLGIGGSTDIEGVNVKLNSIEILYSDEPRELLRVNMTISNYSDSSYYVWPVAFDLNGAFGEVETLDILNNGIIPGENKNIDILFNIEKNEDRWILHYNFYDKPISFLVNRNDSTIKK